MKVNGMKVDESRKFVVTYRKDSAEFNTYDEAKRYAKSRPRSVISYFVEQNSPKKS